MWKGEVLHSTLPSNPGRQGTTTCSPNSVPTTAQKELGTLCTKTTDFMWKSSNTDAEREIQIQMHQKVQMYPSMHQQVFTYILLSHPGLLQWHSHRLQHPHTQAICASTQCAASPSSSHVPHVAKVTKTALHSREAVTTCFFGQTEFRLEMTL